MGTAKTKKFRVPERQQHDPIEKENIMKWSANYRTELKAIRKFLRSEYEKKQSETTVLHKSPEQIETEWAESIAKNAAWNAECSKLREMRLQKLAIEQQEYVAQKLSEREERERLRLDKIREIVLKEQKALTTFITPENIEQAIEHALANPVDYNYAIDLEGNMYRGREGTEPEPVFKAAVSTSQQAGSSQ